jgi:hypothetical protein
MDEWCGWSDVEIREFKFFPSYLTQNKIKIKLYYFFLNNLDGVNITLNFKNKQKKN